MTTVGIIIMAPKQKFHSRWLHQRYIFFTKCLSFSNTNSTHIDRHDTVAIHWTSRKHVDKIHVKDSEAAICIQLSGNVKNATRFM